MSGVFYFYKIMKKAKSVYTVTEAKRALENYCAYQERCHQEVERKLQKMNMIPEAREQITQHLLEHDYLNEGRFAELFVRSKFRQKGWGRKRLGVELRRRNISSINARRAMAQISEGEYLNRFHEIVDKRLSQLEGETSKIKKKKKLVDYLLYRGWESHLAYQAANERLDS